MTYSNAVQEPEVDDEELWAVRLATGATRVMTLEQLDAAFQAGHIDEETAVIEAGGSQWVRLGDILGSDDDAPPSGPTQHAPVANDVYGDARYGDPAHDAYAQPVQQAYAPPAYPPQAYAPQGYAQQGYAQEAQGYAQQGHAEQAYPQQQAYGNPHQPHQPHQAPQVYAQDPYAVPAPAYRYDHGPSQAPVVMQAAPNAYAPSLSPGFNSMRPVVSEVSDFELERGLRPSKGKRGVVALLVIGLLGGGGYVASRNPAVLAALQGVTGQHPETATATVAAAVEAPPAPQAAAAPTPVFVAPSPGGGALAAALAEPAPGRALSPAQKEALSKADKVRAGKHKAKSAAPSSAPRKRKGGGTPFHNGGDKYDPLNGSL